MCGGGFRLVDRNVSLASCPGTAAPGATLFVLGGRRPEGAWLADFATRNAAEVWAVDAGAAACRSVSIAPDAVIGDMDSADSADWDWALACGAREFRHPADKDRTDFQIALDLWGRGAAEARGVPVATGCFGGRTDHLFSVADSLGGICGALGVFGCMLDEVEGLVFLPSGGSLDLCFSEAPVAVSLLSMSEACKGVDIDGVRWPLEDTELRRGLPWAISNRALPSDDGAVVRARCGEGVLGIYWCMEKMEGRK